MIRFFEVKKLNKFFQPALNDAVRSVIESGELIRSKQVEEFETSFASFTGSKHCIGVGNGFDALQLIFRAWILSGQLEEGDEVLVPSNTYIASILSIVENRLVPVLIEPDPETYNISEDLIEARITKRTKAIMLVHLYGRNSFTIPIKNIADQYNLKIVEDNAQAAGCYAASRRTGSLGHAAAHSFFPTKNLGALGDGGAVTTNDTSVADMIRTLGNYGSHKKG